MKQIAERFIRYAKIDTQSDPHSITFPSTEKQKNLSRFFFQPNAKFLRWNATKTQFDFDLSVLCSIETATFDL